MIKFLPDFQKQQDCFRAGYAMGRGLQRGRLANGWFCAAEKYAKAAGLPGTAKKASERRIELACCTLEKETGFNADNLRKFFRKV